jgi:hypothetical protein
MTYIIKIYFAEIKTNEGCLALTSAWFKLL